MAARPATASFKDFEFAVFAAVMLAGSPTDRTPADPRQLIKRYCHLQALRFFPAWARNTCASSLLLTR